MQGDDNEISLEDLDEIVIDESIASSSNIISNTSDDDVECENVEEDCEDDSSPIYVPNDPTTWSEKHIETWAKWCTSQFKVKPPLDPSRFPKSGEELAKFSKADFYISCASFEGGRQVGLHFKYLMENIGGKFDETLNSNEDPSKQIFLTI